MRRPLRSRALLACLFVLGACGSDGDGGGDKSAAPDGGSSPPGADDNTVRVARVDRHGFATGTVSETQNTIYKFVSAAAIVTVDGAVKSIPGTVGADNAITIQGVPNGPYTLEVRTRFPDQQPTDPPDVEQFPIDGARQVRLFSDFWARKDTVGITPTTKIGMTLGAPETFTEGDQFLLAGRRSYFSRRATFGAPIPQQNPPNAGANTSTSWTFAAGDLGKDFGDAASGLPSASAADDLTLLHYRQLRGEAAVDRFDPWHAFTRQEVVGVLEVLAPNFTNETTNAISGTLAAPTREQVTVNFRGSTFAAVRSAATYPKNAFAAAQLTVTHQPGPGPGFTESASPRPWQLAASSTEKPVSLECYPGPDSSLCDPAVCAVGCDKAFDGYRDPGDVTYSFAAPSVGPTSEGRDFYNYAYTYTFTTPLANGDYATLAASASGRSRKTSSSLSVELELGPVQTMRVDGGELPWTGATVATSPTITFAPPALATPTHYRVSVVELKPDGKGATSSRLNGGFVTRATSVTIPEGLLIKGHFYYLRVGALIDDMDSSAPYTLKSEKGLITEVFSPPFQIKGN